VIAIGWTSEVAVTAGDRFEAIAQREHTIWNGVRVSADGRIFAKFPPLSSGPLESVGEIGRDSKSHAYPGVESLGARKAVEHAFVGTNAVLMTRPLE
jgi:hypothetical protein